MINMQKDNVTIMVGVDINEVINEFFESLFRLESTKNVLKHWKVAILFLMALKNVL